MIKKIYTLCFFLYVSLSYSQTTDVCGKNLYANDFKEIMALSPVERVNYFNSLPFCNGEESDLKENNEEGYWYGEYSEAYNVRGYYTVRVRFIKYYRDKDNDGFPDDKNDYVFFSWIKSDFCRRLSLGFPDQEHFEEGYLSSNHNYSVKEPNGNIVSITTTDKTYFYNNSYWVRGAYGFDCDDTNSNSPQYIQRIYPDRDYDGLGNSSLYSGTVYQKFIPECTTPQSWDYEFPYAYNNDDCNDNDDNVGTNPITWYRDLDDDRYGDANNTIIACKQPNGYVLNNEDCDDTNPNYNNKQITWYADFDGDGFGDKNDTLIAVCPPDNYVTNCYFDECPTQKGTRDNGCPVVTYDFDNENHNYTYERTYLEPVKVNELTLVSANDVLEDIVYTDELGRVKQTNQIKQSASGKDIITYYQYNSYGEQTKEYLPFTKINNGAFVDNGYTETRNFYNTPEYENTLVPFSDKLTENSPLSRVLEKSAPGDPWELDTGNEDYNRTLKFVYTYNSISDNVKRFTVAYENNKIETPKLTQNLFYGDNELTKTITKGENWQPDQTYIKDHTTEVFKNEKNEIVLKRNYDKNIPHDTYYVYDVFGNLTFVLSPEASRNSTITQDVLDKLGYQYKYDAKRRIIEKKEPGKEKEYIVYDTQDRPILTQNALQRKDNKWTYIKYDFKERVVYSGDYERNISREALQNEINTATGLEFYESKTSSAVVISGENLYYTNSTFPTDLTKINTHVVNYYDDYENILPVGLANKVTTSFGEESTNNTLGLLTVNKTAVLNTSHWIITVVYYDDNGRPIYIHKHNPYLETVDIVEYRLDFTGKILETKETHEKLGNEAISIFNKLEYDRVGRFLSQNQCLAKGEGRCDSTLEADRVLSTAIAFDNSKTEYASNSITLSPGFSVKATTDKSYRLEITDDLYEKIVTNTYDELGRVKAKEVGGKGSQRLQKVDFAYNIRGWLKKVNDDSNDDNDLFNLTLSYNNPTSATPLFNGNISEITWSTQNIDSSTKKYSYEYDALNRLTKADDNASKYNTTTSYDQNGNIMVLTRKGHVNNDATVFGLMDDLKYDYDGNKLMKVMDDTNVDFGFKDNEGTEDDYAYDESGNIVSDLNKGITSISYNHLNLPVAITTDKGTITYVYDAAGNKLSKTIDEVASSNNKTTEYSGYYVYYKEGTAESKLQFITQTEGYIKSEGDKFTYVYQHKDHLGNIRLSYADLNDDGVIDKNTEILDESNYYPFGLKHKDANSIVNPNANLIAQKFGYNSKEFEQAIGANLYEMDWRSYDSSIARWLAIDPVTHFSMSPYNAFDNNPVYWSDPSGADSFGGYFGKYDLEWGGYMMDPNDANFSDEGQYYGYDYNFDGGFGEYSEYLKPVMVQATPKFKPFGGDYDDRYDYKDFERDMDEFDELDIQIISEEDWNFLKNFGRVSSATSKGFGLLEDYLKVKNTTAVLGTMNQISSNVFVWNKIGTWSPKIGQTSGIFGWTFLSTKTFKAIGRFGGYGSILMTGVDVLNGDISVERGIADSAATFAMMYGGPWGMALGITYHGLMWANDNGYLHPVDFTKLDEGRNWGNTCFVAGTKILLNNGEEKNIEDVRVGDSILSVNMNTMKVEKDVVVLIPLTQEKYTKIRITSENGIENIASPHHPFYVKGKGWAVYDVKMAEKDLNFKVSNLEVGDVIYYYEKNKLKETKITKLVDEKEKVKMYNLKYVKKNNTFFANGILVHNRYN